MEENKTKETKEVPTDERWEKTNKQKKFLKKPNNKTAVKHFFKELLEQWKVTHPVEETPMIDSKILTDLETCSKIFKVANLSTKFHLKVLLLLSQTLCVRNYDAVRCGVAEMFFNYVRHDLVKLFVQMLIRLKEKVLEDEELPTLLFRSILDFFLTYVAYERVRKLLRKTENFDVISDPNFWEPIFLSVEDPELCSMALMFPMKILNPKSFSADFVEMYVNRLREIVPLIENPELLSMARIQLISQRLLESDQKIFFLKLVSRLPENMKKITEKPTDLTTWDWKTVPVGARLTALVDCANCEKTETSQREFAKCSRCNFVHYCSNACQKADWQSHKEICK